MMMRDSATQLGRGDVLDDAVTADELTYPPQATAIGTKGQIRRPRAALAAPANPCGATTAKGIACTTPTLAGHPSGRCRMHAAQLDPNLAAQLALERRQGGQALRGLRQLGLEIEPTFSTPEGITEAMEKTAAAVARGAIPSSVAGGCHCPGGWRRPTSRRGACGSRSARAGASDRAGDRAAGWTPMTRQADRLRAVRERLANLERPEELRLDVAHAFNLTPEEFAERMPGCPAVLIIKPAAARRVRKSPR